MNDPPCHFLGQNSLEARVATQESPTFPFTHAVTYIYLFHSLILIYKRDYLVGRLTGWPIRDRRLLTFKSV